MQTILSLQRSKSIQFLLVSLFFFCLTVLVTWPLILYPTTLVIDRFDGLLITWFLNWDIHALSGGLNGAMNLFNANIFYPYSKTLAFSEIMVPSAILAAPFLLVFKEPLLAYNVNFFLGFILTGISLFYLLQFLSKDTKVSILMSTLFTFSTIHLNYMSHLQLFNIWPIILTFLFVLRRNYKLYLFFFVVSVLTGILNLYFLLFSVSIIVFFQRKDIVKIGLVTAASLTILMPFLLPYYFVSKQFHYTRPINDAIHFSLQFPDLANISSINRLSTVFGPIDKTTPAFPGVVFTLLIAALLYYLYKQFSSGKFLKFKSAADISLLSFLAIALVSFILSLGPALHLRPDTVHIGPLKAFPLPYAVFYYLVPGFSGFRTPSRWILLTFLSLSIAIGLVFKRKCSTLLTMVIIVLIFAEIRTPLQYAVVPSVKHFPPEQRWLATLQKKTSIIQFPIYNWDDNSAELAKKGQGFGLETLREYYSTIHYQPMFNGFSGFSPKEWESRVKSLQKDFPSDSSIQYLQSIKIELVLVPKDWENRMSQFKQLQKIKQFPNTIIYKLI